MSQAQASRFVERVRQLKEADPLKRGYTFWVARIGLRGEDAAQVTQACHAAQGGKGR